MSQPPLKIKQQAMNHDDYAHLNYAFNVKDALNFDVFTAIFLYNLRYWLRKNKASEKHFEQGRVWSYNTAEALSALFPWVSVTTVERTIRKLKAAGLLLVQCLSGDKFNKTNWLSLNEDEFLIDNTTQKTEESLAVADSVKLKESSPSTCPNRVRQSDGLHAVKVAVSSPSERRNVTDINNTNINTNITIKDKKPFVEEMKTSNSFPSITPQIKKITAVIQTKQGKHWGTAIDLKITEHIYLAVASLSGEIKEQHADTKARWANEVRLMREKDKHDPADIIELFNWAHADPFWSANILSPSKLRKQWLQLKVKRKAKHNAPRPAYPSLETESGWSSGVIQEDF